MPFICRCGGQKEIKEMLEMSSPAIANTGKFDLFSWLAIIRETGKSFLCELVNERVSDISEGLFRYNDFVEGRSRLRRHGKEGKSSDMLTIQTNSLLAAGMCGTCKNSDKKKEADIQTLKTIPEPEESFACQGTYCVEH